MLKNQRSGLCWIYSVCTSDPFSVLLPSTMSYGVELQDFTSQLIYQPGSGNLWLLVTLASLEHQQNTGILTGGKIKLFFFSALYLHGVAMGHTSHRLLSGSSLSTQHFSLQILFPFTHSVLGMAKDLPLFLAQVTAVFIVVSLYPAHIIKSPSVIYPS